MVLVEKQMVFFVIIVIIFGVSKADDVYKVGDSAGWTNIGHVDYKSWSGTKKFHVGDTILFEYNKQFHNVVRVTHNNFNSCNATSPYATFTSGNDSFTIRKTGHFYFICSVPGHCEAGQKVDIRVPAAPHPSSSPAPTPSQPSRPPSQAPARPSASPYQPSSPSSSPSPSPASAPGVQKSNSALSLSTGVLTRKLWLLALVLAFCVSGNAY